MINEIKNFLTLEECKEIIELIDKDNQKSTVVIGGTEEVGLDKSRTSSTSNLPDIPFIQQIKQRIATTLGLKVDQGEPIQGQLYNGGEYFRPHFDWFGEKAMKTHGKVAGQRTHTLMIYLNDDFTGGETNFSAKKLSVKPELGKAVWWRNTKDDGTGDESVLHEGSDVVSGTKYIITAWFRERNFINPQPIKESPLEIRTESDIPQCTPLGFKKVKVPDETWKLILETYSLLKDKEVDEHFQGKESIIQGSGNSTILSMDHLPTLRSVIHQQLHQLHEDWAGREIEPSFIYGIRSYKKGATLAMHHVWGGELTARRPDDWQRAYAQDRVYALDFDARSVKIAQAINLIAGDGRTHVYRVNTLDPRTWDEEARVGLRPRLQRFANHTQDDWNQRNYRHFVFHVVFTNPPFAGEIRDTRLLHQYELAQKENGKWQTRMGRDILFIERNLEFLMPGGRMAIVLPQGRFNNISDERIRRFIADRCRILAVVGLPVNTFKPHTGTKTSVLFVQKWNDDPEAGPLCPRVEDYPIFFAVSQQPVKDNSGEYVYLEDDNGEPLLDLFNHRIHDHDLFDIKAVLESQLQKLLERDAHDPNKCTEHRARYERLLPHIPEYPTVAEAFIEFARAQGLSFAPEE